MIFFCYNNKRKQGYYMDYALILIAVLCNASCFCVSKQYQRRVGAGRSTGLFYSFLSGFLSFAVFGAANGLRMEWTWFSAVVAFFAGLCGLIYMLAGFQMMDSGNYSVYMICLLTGGTVSPFLYGMLFLHEPVSWLRCIGILLMTTSVVISYYKHTKRENLTRRYRFLCAVVFVANGAVSILSKVHQVETQHAVVDTVSYAMMTSLMTALTCGVLLLIHLLEPGKSSVKGCKITAVRQIPLVSLGALIGCMASFLQLKGAASIDASLLYPMMTGGMIICSVLAGRFVFKEALSKSVIVSTVICFAATLFFVEP